MQITMISADETRLTDPDLTQDLEWQTLPLQGPAIEAAHTLFTPEEDDRLRPLDIMEIILSCLKEVKKSHTKYAIKTLSQLIAVSEYVKHHA